jgi:hypothetical protein
MDQRKVPLEKCVECRDGLGRRIRFLAGNGRDANGFGEPLNGPGVDRQRSGWLAERLGCETNGIERQDGDEREQQDGREETDPFPRFQKSTLS